MAFRLTPSLLCPVKPHCDGTECGGGLDGSQCSCSASPLHKTTSNPLLKVAELTLGGVLVRITIAMTKHRGQKQAGEERVLWLAPSYP